MRSIVACFILLFVLTGCAAPARLTRLFSLKASPTASPTLTTAPTPARTPAVSVTETPAPATESESAATSGGSEPVLDDLSIYTATLRPSAAKGRNFDGLTRYRMDVALSADLDQLSGTEDIRYTNRENVPLDRVYLHLYPNLSDAGLTVSDVRVDGAAVQVAYPSGDDVVEIPLDSALAVGHSVDLSLRFDVPIPANEQVGNYGEFAYRDDTLALAHFYPTVAVYTGDRWHIETPALQGDVIFHDASLYDVRFTGPGDLKVVATGVTVERVMNADGTATWRLAGGPMRDFNVAASADYRMATGSSGDVTINSYYLPGDDKAGREALSWATAALRTFETAIGPYPYRELDIAATGTLAAGIEYPGMIVIATDLYGREQRQPSVEAVVVHELAHQWWYGIVGNDQLNDPWLDEAMAQYSTYRYFRKQYGPQGGEDFQQALEARWERENRVQKPVGLPVSEYQDGEYSAIVYGRGPLFLIALEKRLGDLKMTEFVRRYYREEMWKIATPQRFQALAEEVAGEDLDDIFNEWVYPEP